MKTSTKLRTESTVSKSRPNAATCAPMLRGSGRPPRFLRLVEEAAALEQAGALLRRDLDVSRREQEHLVRDALHAPGQPVREPAGGVDPPLRQLLVGAVPGGDD